MVTQCAFALALPVGVLPSLRRVLLPEVGMLALLGDREKLLPKRLVDQLRHFSVGTRCFAALWVAVGCAFVYSAAGRVAGAVGYSLKVQTDTAKVFDVLFLASCALYCATILPLVCVWIYTLRVATTIARHDAGLVHASILSTSPADDAWHERVETPFVTLARDVLPKLSEGWGIALAFVMFGFWIGALGWLVLALLYLFIEDDVRITMLMVGLFAVMLIFTLWTGNAPAATSTLCAELMEDLNNKRFDQLTDLVHGRLERLEAALYKMNFGQGPGFLIGRALVDNTRLHLMLGQATSIAVMLVAWMASNVAEKQP